MSDYRQCVLCSKPREADVGLLCNHHIQHFADMLREVEDEAALLDAVPSMMARPGRGASLASHRSPANLDVIVAQDPRRGTGRIGYDDTDPWGIDDTASILDTLHSWARIVREERGLTDTGSVTISGERDVLSRHLTWVAGQPWCDDAFKEIRALLGQLRATNRTRGAAPEGSCYLPTDEGTCGGSIRRQEEPAQPWVSLADRCVRTAATVADGLAYCDRCGAEWAPDAVVRFVTTLEQQRREDARPRTDDGRAMRTAHELSSDLGIPVSTVRTRLSRLKVKATEGHYDPQALTARRDTQVTRLDTACASA